MLKRGSGITKEEEALLERIGHSSIDITVQHDERVSRYSIFRLVSLTLLPDGAEEPHALGR